MKTTATILAAVALLTACETVEGIGRDTEKLGSNVENAAEQSDNNSMDDSTATGR